LRLHRFTVAHVCWLALAACDGGDPDNNANPDDVDGDGVVNADDNCPDTSNAAQHDEDGDTVGDACDNCPADVNANQADTTEREVMQFPDGVGDVCDPRPASGGDALRGFYAFAEAAETSAWTGTGWQVSDDAAHAVGNAQWASSRGVMGDGVIVVAHVASVTFGGAGSGLILALDGDGNGAGGKCTLNASQLVVIEAGGGTSSTTFAPIANGTALELVAWRVINRSTGAAELNCIVTMGGASEEVSLPLSDDLALGTHTISTAGASVDVSSLSIYTTPIPKNP
jgi:hypothetical protein